MNEMSNQSANQERPRGGWFFFRAAGLILLSCAVMGAILLAIFSGPRSPERFAEWQDPQGQPRSLLIAKQHAIVAGTPWAADAGFAVLEAGGTACDAAVTAVLMLNVTFSEAASFPGIAPALVYNGATGRMRSYVGVGVAPARATIDLFRERGYDEAVPKNSILAQLVPASPDVLTTLLRDCGSRSFAEAVAPAIERARDGFPVHRTMLKNFDLPLYKRFGFAMILPYNAEVFLNGEWWRPLHHKDEFRLPDLANTLAELAAAERAAYANPDRGYASEAERRAGLVAVRDYFYEGPIAQKIVAFHNSEGGLMQASDLSEYRGAYEEPLSMELGGFRFSTNRTWTQGIVVLQTLQILAGIDLRGMGHNSPEYIHTVAQAIELAMADREAFAGDPRPGFTRRPVPVERLISPEYAATRRALMTPGTAFGRTPPPGEPFRDPTAQEGERKREVQEAESAFVREVPEVREAVGTSVGGWKELAQRMPIDFAPGYGEAGRDTSYVSVIDSRGNAVSITPSDFPLSPMVPDTGLTLGIRMTQFRLDSEHPSALMPGKRPRVTPHALMISHAGRLYMSLGTPGGEMQTQALVQIWLNHAIFGMNLQQALEAPRFRSRNWPDAFAPHEYLPGRIDLEDSLANREFHLSNMGYDTKLYPDLDNHFSAVGAIARGPAGQLRAAADPREETTALGK